jgi:hypothetical protein
MPSSIWSGGGAVIGGVDPILENTARKATVEVTEPSLLRKFPLKDSRVPFAANMIRAFPFPPKTAFSGPDAGTQKVEPVWSMVAAWRTWPRRLSRRSCGGSVMKWCQRPAPSDDQRSVPICMTRRGSGPAAPSWVSTVIRLAGSW